MLPFLSFKKCIVAFIDYIQGVPKNIRLGRRLRGILTVILIRMKGPSIITNMRKISVMLTVFYSNIKAKPSLFTRAHIVK